MTPDSPTSAAPPGPDRARHGSFGALPDTGGVRFRVAAPATRDLRLQLLTGASAGTHRPRRDVGGVFELFVPGARAGDRYTYTLDGSPPRPDPASRFQPNGVHGSSEVIDPEAYRWQHAQWPHPVARDLVVYELHIGTFTPAGTFAAARERLGDLRDLGVTAVELMPVADFPGARNWGYDGVCLYAPARVYGRPDDLRELVDAAHALGISVLLDVVYNHLGPEGAYLPQFNPAYLTDRHSTPWGGAVNLDGPGSDLVRSFIVDNATHWIREYRLDGLRLDATHALIDTSPTHVVSELVHAVRDTASRPLFVYGEDHRNLAALVEPRDRNGWGLDGVWADDFHHIVRRALAGDAHGYYADFAGSPEELARTIRQGWLFIGQPSRHRKGIRGTDPSQIPMHRFVVCLQNHDQIGNRATGDRLHHGIEPAAWRAASAVLLTVPMTPLLFMGQEWAASTPFQYFTDLEPDLGRLVTDGRRLEFKAFPEFSDPEARARIPDPQAASTFEASRLNWSERLLGIHGASLALYKELLRLRRAWPALGADAGTAGDAMAVGGGGLALRREQGGETFCILAQLSRTGTVAVPDGWANRGVREVVLSTEDARFAPDPAPPRLDLPPGGGGARFFRPGAVILRLA